MTETFFTADHHFFHANIIKYVNRPFGSAMEMDEEMIRRWNVVVGPDDLVYHLGDFTLGNWERAASVLRRLNGYIKLVPGGHDESWIRRRQRGIVEPPSNWEILSPLASVKAGGMEFVLCHYPMASWERSHYGFPHLHGHCHGTIGIFRSSRDTLLPPGQITGVSIDVGVDCWEFAPISLEEILEYV